MIEFKFWVIIIITFILLIIKIYVSHKNLLLLKYITTPLTTISIILIALLAMLEKNNQYSFLITLALIFSLVGDVFNMLVEKEESYLQFGMIFFLLTHILYIYSFITLGYSFALWHIPLIIILIALILFANYLFKEKLTTPVLKIGILVYTIFLSSSVYFALAHLTYSINLQSILLTIGIIFFYISDFFLGYNQFRKPLPFHPLLIWIFYIPGQALIALSILS